MGSAIGLLKKLLKNVRYEQKGMKTVLNSRDLRVYGGVSNMNSVFTTFLCISHVFGVVPHAQ